MIRPSGQIPTGTRFTLATEVPSGWNIQITEITGVVTIQAPAHANAGASLTMPVRISYCDGSYEFTYLRLERTAEPQDIDLDDFIDGDGNSSLGSSDVKVDGSSGSSVEGASSALPILGIIALIGGSLAALWPILSRAFDAGFIYFR